MPGVPPQGRRGRRDAWGGGVGVQCWRRVLKGMASPSGPVWVAGSCIVRLAAKGAWAAWVSNADHLAMDAWMAAGRRAWGTALLLACARRRRKSAASSLHRPPTSMAKTTRRQRSPRTSSGYVRSLACLAARRAGEPGWRPCRRGSPVLVKGETRVVSTANWAPLYRGSPCAMTSIRRLSSLLVVVTLRSVTRTCVRTLAPASLHTRAAARSRGPALLRNAPDVAHAARWSPKESRGRRHRQ